MTLIKDWDGLGPLSQASYLRFPHLSLPETQGLQAHSAPPRSEALEARRAHRRMGQEGGWGRSPSTQVKVYRGRCTLPMRKLGLRKA